MSIEQENKRGATKLAAILPPSPAASAQGTHAHFYLLTFLPPDFSSICLLAGWRVDKSGIAAEKHESQRGGAKLRSFRPPCEPRKTSLVSSIARSRLLQLSINAHHRTNDLFEVEQS